ncbi:MAG: type II toxin-antitoxin system HipA family toxin [Cytophagaceae bacterium]|jgi:serine/threonine-protein kinase HipA|nr:type II toxin-antitoxin system HipA family toxin [Cytophagaceae bacterium]
MVVAHVKLWNRLVGAVLWNQDKDYASFEYDDSFIQQGWDIAPIIMPIAEARKGRIYQFASLPKETFHGLPGILSDVLPDRFGNQLIDLWIASKGQDAQMVNPVERLCYMGTRGMGALEFEPSVRLEKERSYGLDIDTLVALSKKALSIKESLDVYFSKEDAETFTDIIRVGTSAGGARAKAVVAYNEKNGEVRSGQLQVPEGFEHWLIKFDGVTNTQLGDPKGYGRIEYAYYKMAVNAGIHMMPSILKEENGRAHFMTKRFDRKHHNEKVHMQTLCGLCHFDYNNPNVYSYEQAFQAMRMLRLPYSDAEQLFTRMVFNVIARNQDDHTKNISFLMDTSGTWKLSPAYDVTYAYHPSNKWIARHQLSIQGKRENITIQDFTSLAKEMNIKKAKEIIERVQSTIADWKLYAKDAGVENTQIKAIANTHLLNLK